MNMSGSVRVVASLRITYLLLTVNKERATRIERAANNRICTKESEGHHWIYSLAFYDCHDLF
jgi:hypothetical protein